jgi:hypothetical protein
LITDSSIAICVLDILYCSFSLLPLGEGWGMRVYFDDLPTLLCERFCGFAESLAEKEGFLGVPHQALTLTLSQRERESH